MTQLIFQRIVIKRNLIIYINYYTLILMNLNNILVRKLNLVVKI